MVKFKPPILEEEAGPTGEETGKDEMEFETKEFHSDSTSRRVTKNRFTMDMDEDEEEEEKEFHRQDDGAQVDEEAAGGYMEEERYESSSPQHVGATSSYVMSPNMMVSGRRRSSTGPSSHLAESLKLNAHKLHWMKQSLFAESAEEKREKAMSHAEQMTYDTVQDEHRNEEIDEMEEELPSHSFDGEEKHSFDRTRFHTKKRVSLPPPPTESTPFISSLSSFAVPATFSPPEFSIPLPPYHGLEKPARSLPPSSTALSASDPSSLLLASYRCSFGPGNTLMIPEGYNNQGFFYDGVTHTRIAVSEEEIEFESADETTSILQSEEKKLKRAFIEGLLKIHIDLTYNSPIQHVQHEVTNSASNVLTSSTRTSTSLFTSVVPFSSVPASPSIASSEQITHFTHLLTSYIDHCTDLLAEYANSPLVQSNVQSSVLDEIRIMSESCSLLIALMGVIQQPFTTSNTAPQSSSTTSNLSSYTTLISRRAALTKWLQTVLEEEINDELRYNESERTRTNGDRMADVWTYLSVYDIESAVAICTEIGDIRLSSIISQFGDSASHTVTSELSNQLRQWRNDGRWEFMSEEHRNVYALLAGEVTFQTTHSISWLRSFALHFWYSTTTSTSNEPIHISLQRYVRSVENGAAPVPLAKYVTEGTLDDVLDLRYHLLTYLTSHSPLHLLRSLTPESYTANSMNYTLIWHLYTSLRYVLPLPLSMHVSSSLYVNYATQLCTIQNGEESTQNDTLWHWACYVLWCTHRHGLRGMDREYAIKDILSRMITHTDEKTATNIHVAVSKFELTLQPDVSSDADSFPSTPSTYYTKQESFLVDKVGIPVQWVHLSKLHYALSIRSYISALFHAIHGEAYDTAHTLLIQYVSTRWMLTEQIDLLISTLQQLSTHAASIPGWKKGGHMVLRYLLVQKRVHQCTETIRKHTHTSEQTGSKANGISDAMTQQLVECRSEVMELLKFYSSYVSEGNTHLDEEEMPNDGTSSDTLLSHRDDVLHLVGIKEICTSLYRLLHLLDTSTGSGINTVMDILPYGRHVASHEKLTILHSMTRMFMEEYA